MIPNNHKQRKANKRNEKSKRRVVNLIRSEMWRRRTHLFPTFPFLPSKSTFFLLINRDIANQNSEPHRSFRNFIHSKRICRSLNDNCNSLIEFSRRRSCKTTVNNYQSEVNRSQSIWSLTKGPKRETLPSSTGS